MAFCLLIGFLISYVWLCNFWYELNVCVCGNVASQVWCVLFLFYLCVVTYVFFIVL